MAIDDPTPDGQMSIRAFGRCRADASSRPPADAERARRGARPSGSSSSSTTSSSSPRRWCSRTPSPSASRGPGPGSARSCSRLVWLLWFHTTLLMNVERRDDFGHRTLVLVQMFLIAMTTLAFVDRSYTATDYLGGTYGAAVVVVGLDVPPGAQALRRRRRVGPAAPQPAAARRRADADQHASPTTGSTTSSSSSPS